MIRKKSYLHIIIQIKGPLVNEIPNVKLEFDDDIILAHR